MVLLLAAVAALAAGSTPAGAQEPPAMAAVLSRAGQYAVAYERRFSLLVAEEHYVQRSERGASSTGPVGDSRRGMGSMTATAGRATRRTLRSDFLLVRDENQGWVPYRDVFEVDGKQIRDREDRMVKLLVNPSASSMDRAARIMNESSRYNLGRVVRTINIPTLGIVLMQPELRDRVRFAPSGEATVGDRTAVILSFEEHGRPTLVRTTNGRDLPMEGRVWIEPASGTVLRTEMVLVDTDVRASITVTYRFEPVLDFWVPAEMVEHYLVRGGIDEIRCTATYANYRRFSVSTTEEIQKPPVKPPPQVR